MKDNGMKKIGRQFFDVSIPVFLFILVILVSSIAVAKVTQISDIDHQNELMPPSENVEIKEETQIKEVVFMVYNSDPSKDVMVVDHKNNLLKVKYLTALFKKINPNLELIPLPLATILKLPEEVKKKMDGAKLRGLVFFGHGSETSYAFSNFEYYTGYSELVFLIQKILEQNKVSSKFLLYFNGCLMANGRRSFQESLMQSLLRKEVEGTEIEIIAHENSTNIKGGQWLPPNKLERYLINSKVGMALYRFHKVSESIVGGYSPLVMNSVLALGVPGLIWALDGSLAFLPLGYALTHVVDFGSNSVGKLGIARNSASRVKGYVFDLLNDHFKTHSHHEHNNYSSKDLGSVVFCKKLFDFK